MNHFVRMNPHSLKFLRVAALAITALDSCRYSCHQSSPGWSPHAASLHPWAAHSRNNRTSMGRSNREAVGCRPRSLSTSRDQKRAEGAGGGAGLERLVRRRVHGGMHAHSAIHLECAAQSSTRGLLAAPVRHTTRSAYFSERAGRQTSLAGRWYTRNSRPDSS